MSVRTGPVSREEFDALITELSVVKSEAAAAAKLAKETHDMVQGIYAALMRPQPGQEHNLLDRMASQTIAMESGVKTARMLIGVAAFLAALGAIMKWGAWQP